MVETSKTSFSQCINQIEEAFIAITLGLMTLVTLANVVASDLSGNTTGTVFTVDGGSSTR